MLLDLLHDDPTLAGSRPGGRTTAGVLVRVVQRILALTTAIWHNDHTGRPIKRSLLAYDRMTDPELRSPCRGVPLPRRSGTTFRAHGRRALRP